MHASPIYLNNFHPENKALATSIKSPKKPNWRKLLRYRNRRRGTAVVDTPRGILLVSEDGKTYSLPGGAAKGAESRRAAAQRELEEETGLKTAECSFIFEYRGGIQRNIKGGFFRDSHKVYLIKVTGIAEPKNEITSIAYTSNSQVKLSNNTKRVIKKYFKGRAKI